MEAVLWDLRCRAQHGLGELFIELLLVSLLVFSEYPLMIARVLAGRALGRRGRSRELFAPPSVLIVIPSLLRKRDELTSLKSTIQSICGNGYPGSITVVISIDGSADAPGLYDELITWFGRERRDQGSPVYVTGTPGRRGKPMAIEHGVNFVKRLVSDGVLPELPPVYVSTDADAELGPRALEAIVRRLMRGHWLTGARPNVVAGALHVRGDNYWRGWRHFFTERGQLNLQVARDYYVSNIGRHNLRVVPVTGVPGAFYCTWTSLFLSIPRFMGYLETLRVRHWLLWWLGRGSPSFSQSTAEPLPERIAGDTDDTVTAYVATMGRFVDGRFVLDLPRSPLHALVEMFRRIAIERPIAYEPLARVYTSSPSTTRALFRQRRRWNSSRVELTLRLWPALTYHWSMGLPALVILLSMARGLIGGVLTYLVVPLVFFRTDLLSGFIVVYLVQVLIAATLTFVSFVINDELAHWRLAFALPLVPVYTFVFKWVPAAVGIMSDVFLFGNVTGFSPEWTLKRGRSVRVALLFRVRRAFSLWLRSVFVGDVPFGAFWFGWRETKWTPSGFDGWTTGKKPRPIFSWPPIRWGDPRVAGLGGGSIESDDGDFGPELRVVTRRER